MMFRKDSPEIRGVKLSIVLRQLESDSVNIVCQSSVFGMLLDEIVNESCCGVQPSRCFIVLCHSSITWLCRTRICHRINRFLHLDMSPLENVVFGIAVSIESE